MKAENPNSATISGANNKTSSPEWLQSLRKYRKRTWRDGSIQIINTVGPFVALWIASMAIVVSNLPDWISLIIAVPAAFFMVRTFIIFHDSCHGSFLPSRRANTIVGYITGILTFTPFEQWRQSHLKHHATNSQLDHRGTGDVWTMTYDEYFGSQWYIRAVYRIFRFPFVMFVLGPVLLFFVVNRRIRRGGTRRARISVMVTNIFIAAGAVIPSMLFGVRAYLLVQMPILWLAGAVGIWLFFVQHQFDPSYWARDADWDRIHASMSGSSYYKLPAVLNWLTGSIGLHHLHHLQPGIPNYRLSIALKSTPELRLSDALTIRASIRSTRMHLWHEAEKRLIGFREARSIMQQGGVSLAARG